MAAAGATDDGAADLPTTAPAPSAWVVRFAALVPPAARVLDLACGTGRHARWFAARGCRVVAVDRDPASAAAVVDLSASMPARSAEGGAAIALDLRQAAGTVDFHHYDLEAGRWPFAQQSVDAIIVTNYLHRPLLPMLAPTLTDGGVLIYETFAAGNERFGRPRNPDFLLRPGELFDAFAATLRIVAFEDGRCAQPAPARVQRLCALKPPRDWSDALL